MAIIDPFRLILRISAQLVKEIGQAGLLASSKNGRENSNQHRIDRDEGPDKFDNRGNVFGFKRTAAAFQFRFL
jgi:hypothetical protein